MTEIPLLTSNIWCLLVGKALICSPYPTIHTVSRGGRRRRWQWCPVAWGVWKVIVSVSVCCLLSECGGTWLCRPVSVPCRQLSAELYSRPARLLSLAVAVQEEVVSSQSHVTPHHNTTTTTALPTMWALQTAEWRHLTLSSLAASPSWPSAAWWLAGWSVVPSQPCSTVRVNSQEFSPFSNWKQEADSDEWSAEEERDDMEHSEANI